MLRLRTGAPALVCALAALAAPTPAGAVEYGVHTGDTYNSDETNRMAAGGVRVVRLVINWSRVERARNYAFEWDGYDYLVATAAQSGVRVLPILVGTPDWAKHTQEAWPEGRKAQKHFYWFARALAERYGRGGRLWSTYPWLRYLPITAYQVWNEPNLPFYGPGGKPDPRGYARILDLARSAIRNHDEKAQIVLGGMPEHLTEPLSFEDFIEQLLDVKGAKKDFDAIAIHPYASSAKHVVKGAVPRMVKAIRRAGGKKKDVWITELGWSTGGKPTKYVKTPEGQAESLREAFAGLSKRSRRWNLKRVIWFNWRDRVSTTWIGHWNQHAGLFQKDGAMKPAWSAFAAAAGGSPGSGKLEDPQSPDNGPYGPSSP